MVNLTLERELHQHLESMDTNQQEQVLHFARTLTLARKNNKPLRGVSGKSLLPFAGNIDLVDLNQMQRDVTESYEQVNPDEC
jgi:hypothetical protein